MLNHIKRAVLGTPEDEAALAPTETKAIAVVQEEHEGREIPAMDGFDVVLALAGAGVFIELGAPLLLIAAAVFYFTRRSEGAATWMAQAVFGPEQAAGPAALKLFPAAAQGADAHKALPPATVETLEVPAKALETLKAAMPTVAAPLVEVIDERPVALPDALKALPTVVLFDEIVAKAPQSPTAVPLGIDYRGQPVFGDLATDLLHVGIYGTSGAGKDSLLRIWFVLLSQRNPAESLKWVFLDGKGDWLTPDLAHLPQMLFPPAGGYGKKGKDALLAAIKRVDREAERRQGLIFPSGVRTREQYNELAAAKGWEPLPLLVVVASDVMDSVEGEVEELLASLVSKARALGIRVIASMQTPTGKGMEWRMNLSSVLAGALVDGTQDGPALGLREVKELPFRPSKLPPPPATKGVFVAKVRGQFTLLRTPIFAEGAENERRFNAAVASFAVRHFRAEVTPEVRAVVRAEVAPEVTKKVAVATVSPDTVAATAELRDIARKWAEVAEVDRIRVKKILQQMAAGMPATRAIEGEYGVTGGRQFSRVTEWVRLAQRASALMKEVRRAN